MNAPPRKLSTATQNVVDAHDTDPSDPEGSMLAGADHRAPLYWMMLPASSTAMQKDADTHATDVKAFPGSNRLPEAADPPVHVPASPASSTPAQNVEELQEIAVGVPNESTK
jgi:hypothetical protein